MLREFDQLPSGLLDLPASEIHRTLQGPTLFHLPGRRSPALFVSVLMHGNETTGWDAIRALLRHYRPGGGARELPRAVSLFVGNTSAAAAGVRRLPEQPDYNRVWPGSEILPTPEHDLMSRVVEIMAIRGVFASIDIHNNTGLNPHYACVNVIEAASLKLAALFGRTVVYFIRPRGVASMAMSKFCPSVTLECGKAKQAAGADHAANYIETVLGVENHDPREIDTHEIDLYHTVAIVKVRPEISFGFGSNRLNINFPDDLETLNFRELPTGTVFGDVCGAGLSALDVRDELNIDVVGRYFEVSDDQLVTKCPFMPSMLTRDVTVIKQDCLCYLMERYDQHLSGIAAVRDVEALIPPL